MQSSAGQKRPPSEGRARKGSSGLGRGDQSPAFPGEEGEEEEEDEVASASSLDLASEEGMDGDFLPHSPPKDPFTASGNADTTTTSVTEEPPTKRHRS